MTSGPGRGELIVVASKGALRGGCMTLTQTTPSRIFHRPRPSAAARRFGYLVAIAVNAGLLYIANNLLAWEWPPFLTEDFDRVLPLLNVSIVASMVVNGVYLAFDPRWFKTAGDVVTAVFSLAVVGRTLAVFPFDFTPYSFDWETLTRVLLVLMIVATVTGIVAGTVKVIVDLMRGSAAPPDRASSG
jgi:hypothetical protein